MEDARGPGRSPVPARPLRSARGPAAAGQGALSAAGDPPPAAVRHPGGGGRRRRDRAPGRRAPRLPPSLPAVRARGAEPRHAGRGDRRARSRAVQGLLRGVGRRPARGRARPRRHRRQGLAPQPRPEQGPRPLAPVSAWATRQRLVLGQGAVSGKSNEITAIPLLLERLALEGALVTIDAIGAQGAIAEVILRRGGDYLLALKANRPATLKEVAAFFAEPPPGAVDTFEATDGDHGRIAIPRHAVCHDVAWLLSDRRHPDEVAFPGLAMIGMVESTTERGGETSRERRYYLGSARLDAATFARAVRGHWGIENRLHWILDVVFRDDLARLRTGHAPADMAVARHMAMDLLGQAAPSVSLKNRRKPAGWNTAYLETLIRQTA